MASAFGYRKTYAWVGYFPLAFGEFLEGLHGDTDALLWLCWHGYAGGCERA